MLGINIRKFNSLYGVRIRERVGIDFSSNNLKLAHAKVYSNRIEVVNLITHDISGPSDADISRVIRTSFDELKTKSPDIINIIPSHLVITKNIEIPSVDPQEIKDIINLQAGRHTPYSREEIIVDYIDIGTYKNSYSKILLVIVNRNIVNRQFEILDKAGLKLERVFFAPEGLAYSVSKILKLETKDSPVNIVHIDEIFTDFTIIFRDKLIFIRSIPIGARHLTDEKEKYQVKFAEEIKRSLEAYQSEDIEKVPAMLVLTGAVQESKDLEAILGETLYLPIRTIPYLRNLTLSSEVLKATSLAKRSSFLNVIAPLLAWEQLKVDLVPEEVKLRKSLEERGRDLIKTGIFVLTIFILIFSILISKIYFGGAYLNKLDVKYKPLNQEAQELAKDFARLGMIKNYLSKRGYVLEVLAELYNIASAELRLSDIRFDEQQDKFSIKGTAESMSIVFSFVEGMEKSNYFKDVKTKYTTKRKEGTKDVTDFEIAAVLTKKE